MDTPIFPNANNEPSRSLYWEAPISHNDDHVRFPDVYIFSHLPYSLIYPPYSQAITTPLLQSVVSSMERDIYL